MQPWSLSGLRLAQPWLTLPVSSTNVAPPGSFPGHGRRAQRKGQWPRKRNVSGTFCGCRPRTVTPTLRPTGTRRLADQRPAASCCGEPMTCHELRVGTACPWRRRTCHRHTQPASAYVGWVAGRPSRGPADQAWLRARVGEWGSGQGFVVPCGSGRGWPGAQAVVSEVLVVGGTARRIPGRC
jgi:hypothetical protein